jgi:hypothetical protein
VNDIITNNQSLLILSKVTWKQSIHFNSLKDPHGKKVELITTTFTFKIVEANFGKALPPLLLVHNKFTSNLNQTPLSNP